MTRLRAFHRMHILVLVLLILLTPVISLEAFLCPDTGQTICYDGKRKSKEIACPPAGEPLAQDGSYTINPPSYVEHGDGTVTDNNTGLMWQQVDDQVTRTWDESVSYCTDLNLGGYTDWRLPDIKELSTLADYGQTNKLFLPIPYPGYMWESSTYYWSSSLYAINPVYAWRMNYLGAINYAGTSVAHYVRCVRGASLPRDNFVDNSDGTVTSTDTGLIWQQGPAGPMKWGSALSYCEGLSLGGFSDWRLPNTKELESLSSDSRYGPSIDPALFPAVGGAVHLWSSTTFRYDKNYAWNMTVSNGELDSIIGWGNFNGLKSDEADVLCVRYPSLSVDPPGLAFGIVDPGSSVSRDFIISNTGPSDLAVEPVTLPSPPFAIASDSCSGQTLSPSASCSVTVTFTPAIDGVFTDKIVVFPTTTVGLGGSTRSFLPGTAHSFSYIENGDGTVTDINTGLMWQQGDDGNVYNWYEASGTYHRSYNRKTSDVCGSLTLGGYSDWRLPTKQEYLGLDGDSFPGSLGTQSWTSTAFAADSDSAWIGGYDYFPKSADVPVRCVRGTPPTFGDFVDNGDGTVSDRGTGLMWQQNATSASGPLPQSCENLTLGGYSDWRLPGLLELESITDDTAAYPAVDRSVFYDVPSAHIDYLIFWSDDAECYVNFGPGDIECDPDLSLPLGCSMGIYTCASYQRCVRNSGVGNGEINVSPSALTFGSVEVGTSQTLDISVSNAGAGNLLIETVSVPSAPFSVTADGCSGQTLSPPASCAVTVEFAPLAEQAYTGTITVTSNDSSNPSVTVALSGAGAAPPASLSGVVSDSSSGLPLPNVAVDVTDSAGTHSTTTDSNGAYAFTNLAQGSFAATFSKLGYVPETANGTLVSGQAQTLDIQLGLAPALNVSITSPMDGSVLNATPVTVTGTVTNNASVTVNSTAATVSSGTFSVSLDLVEGANTITVTAADAYGQTASDSITVSLITKGTITGTVTDASTALPLASATVSVTDALNVNHTASTDGTGTYILGNIAAGAFTGSISKNGYSTQAVSSSMSAGQTVIVDAILSPVPPTINNITVTDIMTDSATISWETDQATTGLLEVGTTTSYGSSFPISPAVTLHSFILTGLSPTTSYHFRITATNDSGLSSTSADNTFTTASPPSPITLQITSPVDGATMNRPNTTVQGTILNTLGNETGVVVNGVIAAMYGNTFAANDVPLQDGLNTINITATDTAGNTETASISVTADTTAPHIRLTANVTSGLSPLTTTLRIDGSFSITQSNLSFSGPGTVQILPGTAVDEYDIVITGEGSYTVTADAPDDQGVTYTDSIIIVVLDKAALDSLLQAKWTSMTNSLNTADTNSALSQILELERPSYEAMFNALVGQLPSIMTTQVAFKLMSVQNNVAEYELETLETGTRYSYEVIFIRDQDGLWRIQDF